MPGGSTALGFAILRTALDNGLGDEVLPLIARAESFDALLGSATGPFEPMLARSPTRLAALLKRRGLRQVAALSELLAAVACSVGPDAAASLDAVLSRALVPHSALVTVPVATLFDDAEQEAIVAAMAGMQVTPNLDQIDLRQIPGKPMNYRGYLCVILKATRLCNLRCLYCHDWAEEAASTIGFQLMLRLVQQALSGDRIAVDFVLHGGEPLMIGRRRLLRLLALLALLARPGQVVRTHLQTNGTLLDARWLALLELFGIGVSVSLDGPMALHDAVRRDTLGRATWDRVRGAIASLKARDMLSGILLVVGRGVITLGPERLLDFLQGEDITSICLLAERPAAGQQGGVGRAEYVSFLADVSLARARRGGPTTAIREIDAIARLLRGEGSGFCELAGNCVGTFVTVDASGDVSHCDKYVGDPAFVGGNLWEEPLDAILAGPRFAAIAASALAGIADEAACPYHGLCQGWCPHERYVAAAEYGCCGLAPLFTAIAETLAMVDG